MDAADFIRVARANAGLSQAALASRAGTSQPALSHYEAGRRQPTASTLDRILAAAGFRLAMAPVSLPARSPTSAELARSGAQLSAVLELAAALPVRHEAELRFPRLAGVGK